MQLCPCPSVNDMKVDKVADKVTSMETDMEVDKVADMVVVPPMLVVISNQHGSHGLSA